MRFVTYWAKKKRKLEAQMGHGWPATRLAQPMPFYLFCMCLNWVLNIRRFKKNLERRKK